MTDRRFKRCMALFAVLFVALLTALPALPAGAKAPGPNGRVVFARFDPAFGDTVPYTANPDGTGEHRLTPGPAEIPKWSPDGTRIALLACFCNEITLVNADGSGYTQRPVPAPGFDADAGFACIIWSPDGARFACEVVDPEQPGRNGIYTVRVSDGGDLQRITTAPIDDIPFDYSPDGQRIVFYRTDPTRPPHAQNALFVIGADGRGLQQITPWSLPDCCVASWSPDGQWILFSGQGSLFRVHPDGTGLQKIPLAFASLSRAFEPGWSPDGTKIVFGAFTRRGPGTQREDVYTANADGTNITPVTRTPDQENQPDWGTHPLTP